MSGPSTSGGQCVLVSWPRSAWRWHSVPIQLANGLGIACHSSRGFIFEPVWSMSRIVVIRWKWGLSPPFLMESNRCTHAQSTNSFWTNARASVAHCWGGQFAGGQCQTRGKVERLCASRWSPHWPTTEPESDAQAGALSRQASASQTRHWAEMAQAGARIFNATPRR
jgi:hypothetical protein